MANLFNSFFVSASTQVCSEIPRTKKSPLDYQKNKNMNSFFISPVIHSEIEDIIISLKNGKSTGPFSIPVKLLKLVKSDISRLLACIFNESITLGIFPDKLKRAQVIPIHKKGAHTDPSNYRPISLLSVWSKLFEKLMFKRPYEYLDNLNAFFLCSLDSEKNTQPIMHRSA